MTAQISDLVMLGGTAFSIAAICGGTLFDPESIGIKPVATSTASWRGFHCIYSVEGDRLWLSRLTIGIKQSDVKLGRVEIFGKIPEPSNGLGRLRHKSEIGTHPIDYDIEDIRVPIEFSGGILAGSDFIKELYVHMGFHPAYKFNHVVELIFEDGKLLHQQDRSEQARLIRERLYEKQAENRQEDRMENIEQFIKDSFSLDYGFSGFFRH